MTKSTADRVSVAKDFLEGVDLGSPASRTRELTKAEEAFVPDPTKDQAVLAGGEVISFARGITAERRTAITHSALLAQLVANQAVKDPDQTEAWYNAYFNALTNLGWVIQRKDFATYEAMSDQADVHEAVLQIASSILGAASAGFLLVKASLDALKKLENNSPWITVFRRESQHTRTSRFQVGLASDDPEKGFIITLLAFGLNASASSKQILFFRFKAERATLRQNSGSVTIDDQVLQEVAPAIKEKILGFIRGYIMALPELK